MAEVAEIETKEPVTKAVVARHEHREVLGKDGNPLALNTAFADALAKAHAKKSGSVVVNETKPEPTKEEPAEPAETPEETKTEPVAEPEATETQTEPEKAEEGTEAAKKEPADAKTEEEEEVKPEDLQVLPHDKPKTRRRILGLLKKIEDVSNSEATTKKELAAKDAKLKQLEEELAKVKTTSPEVNEEIKKELDELKMLRRRYQLENDPEVKTKFTSRIDGGEKRILEAISKAGLGEPLIKLIESEGGWTKFSESMKEIPLQDGSTPTAAELAEMIRGKLPVTHRRTVDALVLDIASAKIERDRFFEEESKKADEYFKSQTEAQKKQAEERTRIIEENKRKADEWTNKFLQAEWLKEHPATSEDAKDHNEFVKQVKGELTKALSANSIEDMLKVVEDAMILHKERRELATAQARVKELEAKLKEEEAKWDKHKKAGASTPKSGSIATNGAGAEGSKKPMSIEDAIIAKWREKQRG